MKLDIHRAVKSLAAERLAGFQQFSPDELLDKYDAKLMPTQEFQSNNGRAQLKIWQRDSIQNSLGELWLSTFIRQISLHSTVRTALEQVQAMHEEDLIITFFEASEIDFNVACKQDNAPSDSDCKAVGGGDVDLYTQCEQFLAIKDLALKYKGRLFPKEHPEEQIVICFTIDEGPGVYYCMGEEELWLYEVRGLSTTRRGHGQRSTRGIRCREA